MSETCSTLTELLETTVAKHGPKVFIEDISSGTTLTFEEFGRLVQCAAAMIQQAGIEGGTRTILAFGNTVTFPIAFMAAIHARTEPVILSQDMPISAMQEIADRVGAKAIVSSGRRPEFDDTLHQIIWPDLASISSSALPGTCNAPCSAQDVAYIMFSGGTTGRSKGCVFTHENALAELGALRRAHDLPDDASHLCILPLYHASALYRSFLVPFSQGSRVSLAERFDVGAFWQQVESRRIAFVQAVPAVLSALVVHPSEPSRNVRDHMHFIGSASAPLDKNLIERFETRFGVPVAQAYGLTETTCGLCFNDPRKPDRRPEAAGWPIDIANIMIVDESGDAVADGAQGEITVSGAMMMRTYLDDDDAIGKTLVDGVLYTGDIGYRDSAGRIFIEGRMSDIIQRASFKISPKEIEDALTANPDVVAAAAFGVPHETLGEDIIAYVVCSGEDFSEATLIETLRKKLPRYKIPSRILRDTEGFRESDFKKTRSHYRRKYLDHRGRMRKSTQNATLYQRGIEDKPAAFHALGSHYLRPLTSGDLRNPEYVEAISDPSAQAFTLVGMFPQSEREISSFWDGLQLPDAIAFAVCDQATDQYRGNLLLRVDWISRVGEFGRMIFKKHQHTSASPDGMHMLMDYAFNELGLVRLWGQGANPAAVPSLVRLGFRLEGKMRRHVMRRGQMLDCFLFGILADEYQSGISTEQDRLAANEKVEISKELKDVVAAAFGVSTDEVTGATSPAQIAAWDSLGIVRLQLLVEESFDIELHPSDFVSVTCVADIAHLLSAHTG